MVDRRAFTTLVVGGVAAPKASFAQNSKAVNVFYSGVGPELTLYSVDADNAALVKRDTVSAPANIWPMPVREGAGIGTIPAAIGMFRIGGDGKLEFVRKYDIDATAKKQHFWAGMVTLP